MGMEFNVALRVVKLLAGSGRLLALRSGVWVEEDSGSLRWLTSSSGRVFGARA